MVRVQRDPPLISPPTHIRLPLLLIIIFPLLSQWAPSDSSAVQLKQRAIIFQQGKLPPPHALSILPHRLTITNGLALQAQLLHIQHAPTNHTVSSQTLIEADNPSFTWEKKVCFPGCHWIDKLPLQSFFWCKNCEVVVDTFFLPFINLKPYLPPNMSAARGLNKRGR